MEAFKVLLVDDEVEFLETLTKRMRRRNVHVVTAGTGQEALDVLDKGEPIDVVVLDVRMPCMDGMEVLREIKKRRPLVEVIMLTGHACVEVAIQGMEMGAFDYLMKPMDIDELLFKLQDAHKNKIIQERKIQSMKSIDESGDPRGSVPEETGHEPLDGGGRQGET